MKTMKIIRTFTLASGIFLIAASSAHAEVPRDSTGHILLKTSVVQQNIFNLQLANLDSRQTTVRIENRKGDQFLSKAIKWRYGYSVKFDVSQLPEGSYILTVGQKGQKIRQVFVITAAGIRMSDVKRE